MQYFDIPGFSTEGAEFLRSRCLSPRFATVAQKSLDMSSVQSISGQDGIDALGKAHMCSTPSLRSFRSSGTQVSRLPFQPVCLLVMCLDAGMSRAEHPQESSEVDVEQCHIMPVWASHSTFQFMQQVR